MRLMILGSSSAGNCYILENEQEALIIECGVKFPAIKQALKFKTSKVAGCLVSHEHQDHCKGVNEVMAAGINVYSTKGTAEAMCPGVTSHRLIHLTANKEIKIGGFTILPFDVKHDAADPVNFLIRHPETGNVLFITDTFYVPYSFRNLNNIMVEANYSQAILDEKLRNDKEFLRNRVFSSHMSLDTCKELLKANDLSQVNNIILVHLSNGNSNADQFQKEIKELTGKNVYVADAGVTIENFNKQPF
jgi:phosphoribosyl 1,2-cyclic phosphodiesterase